MNPIIDAALRYARMGWPVVCCAGKNPNVLGNDWYDKATSDENTIRRWYANLERADNVGVLTGVVSWVLDFDRKHGGLESLEDLESKHGRLSDTLQAVTGDSGKHFHFAMPGDFIPHSIPQGKLWKGVEVKAWHSFVVLPPSVHPDTGKTYEWDGIAEVENTPILLAPDWLIQIVKQGGLQAKSLSGAEPINAVIPHGTQHLTLVSLAGSMRDRGMNADEIFAALCAVNSNRCERPGPEDNLRKIAESFMKYAPGKSKIAVSQMARQHQSEVVTTVIQEGKPFADPAYKQPGGKLMLDSKARPESSEYNAQKALEYAPHWHGKLAYDEFTLKVHAGETLCEGRIPAGQEIRDNDIFTIMCHMQGMDDIKVSKSAVFDAVVNVAMANGSHPVRNYLNSLEWDGVERCSHFLNRYMGSEQSYYASAIGRKWLISAVVRIMRPNRNGQKVDTCLILEGDQGTLKSTAIKALTSADWFSDNLPDINNKDTLLGLRGKWIVEIAEIDRIFVKESSDIKQFMSRQVDTFRPPYGRVACDFAREFVFVGTTNHEDYLKDETGGRRFWPIVAGAAVDVEAILSDRDQIWAEAVWLLNHGEEWWLTDPKLIEESKRRQRERYEGDPWDEAVNKFCSHIEDGEAIFVEDILTGPIGRRLADLTKQDRNRVSRILKSMGCKRKGFRWGAGVRSGFERV